MMNTHLYVWVYWSQLVTFVIFAIAGDYVTMNIDTWNNQGNYLLDFRKFAKIASEKFSYLQAKHIKSNLVTSAADLRDIFNI